MFAALPEEKSSCNKRKFRQWCSTSSISRRLCLFRTLSLKEPFFVRVSASENLSWVIVVQSIDVSKPSCMWRKMEEMQGGVATNPAAQWKMKSTNIWLQGHRTKIVTLKIAWEVAAQWKIVKPKGRCQSTSRSHRRSRMMPNLHRLNAWVIRIIWQMTVWKSCSYSRKLNKEERIWRCSTWRRSCFLKAPVFFIMKAKAAASTKSHIYANLVVNFSPYYLSPWLPFW